MKKNSQSASGVRGFIGLLRKYLPTLREDYKVLSLGIFGSTVKGGRRKNSDLDLLIEFDRPPSLFEFIELEHRLSDLLKVKVDLVMKDSLKPRIGRRILDEVVPV